MIRVKIIDPSVTDASFGYGDNASNFAIVVPSNFFVEMRQAATINLHLKRSIQKRPYYFYPGPAEYLFLNPMAATINVNEPVNVNFQQFLADVMSNFMSIAHLIRSNKGKFPSGVLAQTLVGVVPDLSTTTGFVDGFAPIDTDKGKKYASGYEVFTPLIHDILSSPKHRKRLLSSTMASDFSFKNGSKGTAYPFTQVKNQDIIQGMINALEVYGTAGKGQQLMGQNIKQALATRSIVEKYLFASPGGSGAQSSAMSADNQFAASIMYLMYNQIVDSPESYDSVFPAIPTTAQDSSVISPISMQVGSLVKTISGVFSSPMVFGAFIAHRQLSELLEFLETQPNSQTDAISSIKASLASIKSDLSAIAYAPITTLANTVYEYVKRLTSARFLLPEFMSSYVSSTGGKPFAPMPNIIPTVISPTFKGLVPNSTRIVEFGGFDMPYILGLLKQKVADLHSVTNQAVHLNNGILNATSTIGGDYFTHLDNLGTLTDDPALGVIAYPSPTKIYICPTYMPRFKVKANGLYQWFLSDTLYKNNLLLGRQTMQLRRNSAVVHFAWDTEVNIVASPSTGANFATMPVPLTYVDDCYAQSVSNTASEFSIHMARSPHRPMKDIADFFLPLFQSLEGAMVKEDVIANAVASTMFLYKSTGVGSGDFDDATSWEIIPPQIPFIYGYPTTSLMTVNKPSTQVASYKCTVNHTFISNDGTYMAVLHRAVPAPMPLSYIPFILTGGMTVSLPVSTDIYNQCFSEAAKLALARSQSIVEPKMVFSQLMEKLQEVRLSNDLVVVSGWARSYAMFPHIFLSNREARIPLTSIITDANGLLQRMKSTDDANRPYGGIRTFYPTPVDYVEIDDEQKGIYEADASIDLMAEIKSKSGKGTSSSGSSSTPKPSDAVGGPSINHVTVAESPAPDNIASGGVGDPSSAVGEVLTEKLPGVSGVNTVTDINLNEANLGDDEASGPIIVTPAAKPKDIKNIKKEKDKDKPE